ncbi:MAG: DUF2889 domain-containing protein [Candidatus Binatia bacterium]|nr:DUF2889 domain-containing protein [Candidatus Binatia bacterium]
MPSSDTTAGFAREIHVTVEPRRAIGELVDDFHHFRATIEHDGRTITSVTGEALRIPWETCGGSVEPLRGLVGAPLKGSIREVARLAPAKLQCTHLYDAACVAAARAGRGAASTVYRAIVPDRVDGKTRATLHRDGELLLEWDLDGYGIAGPAPFADQVLVGGNFAAWAESTFEAEISEGVLLLNRACIIASGRRIDLDDAPRAIDVPGTSLGVCHTYSAAHGERSHRIVGSARNIAPADDARRASLNPTPADIQHFHKRPR